MPMAALLAAFTLRRRRSLTRRLAYLTALLVGGPPLLVLAVLSGAVAAPTPGPGGLPPGSGPAGPEPASLAASDAAQVAAVPPALRGYFLAAARAYALPPALLAAVGHIESGFTPSAVGPPVTGGPALGMMQFLPSSWTLFNQVPGATPFDPGPAVLAAARHLLSSGAQPGGAFDPVAGLFGYNHSTAYGRQVLAVAASYGYRYDPTRPPNDPARYHYPLTGTTPATIAPTTGGGPVVLAAAQGTAAVACVRAAVVTTTPASGAGGGTVVLRGEDGFLYTYTRLTTLAGGLRPGTVLEPGTPLGTTGGGQLGFSIRHNSKAGYLDPRPYLTAWPHDPTTATGAGPAGTGTAATGPGTAQPPARKPTTGGPR